MEARSLTLPHLPRRAPSFTAILTSGPSFTLLAALAAAGAAYELANGHSKLTLAACTLPLAVWLLTRRTIPLVMLGASIPIINSLTGNGQSGGSGYNVSLSDLMLVLIGGGILLRVPVERAFPASRVLRPLKVPVTVYGTAIVLVLANHLDVRAVAKSGQRFELFLLPLLVGAFALQAGRHILLLRAYVVATTLIALVWPLNHLGLSKNAIGQFIANAILLLIALRVLRRLLPSLLILVPVLFLTVSRGAIVATVVGLAAIVLMQGFSVRALFTRVVLLLIVGAVAFTLMPKTLQQGVTTFSAHGQTAAAYNLQVREQYARDAQQVIYKHPWAGVGVGNYLAGDPLQGAQTSDPHNVVLLQAAEGGYGFAAAFLVLIGGTLLALYAIRSTSLAVAAAAVLAGTVAHGLFDVYWLRGIPILGWLLAGMACAAAARDRPHSEYPP